MKIRKTKKKRVRIVAQCRLDKTIVLPCNNISLHQLIEGTGICGVDGKKCKIIREVGQVWR